MMNLQNKSNTEAALKERIKELTCLYEVSSIISNATIEQIQESLDAVAYSLKKGFQYPKQTEVNIVTSICSAKTDIINKSNKLTSNIQVFNKTEGFIIASLKDNKYSFLKEESQLLDNVALKIGNLIERIEIQQNEISLKRQMEHVDRLGILGEITAGIAHELNTPLANILGFAELIKDEVKGHSNIAEDLDKIIKNAIFSREVVKKLLFFSCEMPQEMEELNLVTSVYNSLSLLEASFKKANVAYSAKIEDKELFVRADKVQLMQIIFNLIINAIYFTPEHGLVTISVSETKKHIVFKVSDEGLGLPEEIIEKVFQPFFSTKPTGEGSGLGLSVVHGIVTSHKGTITAKNNKIKGATFTVCLPKV